MEKAKKQTKTSSRIQSNIMPKSYYGSGEKIESSTPNWVVYALLSIISLIIATLVHGSVLFLTASGIVMLFFLSYISKPVADIQPLKEKNIFENNKIERRTWNNPSEPNPQRKRYLKTINKEDRRAA